MHIFRVMFIIRAKTLITYYVSKYNLEIYKNTSWPDWVYPKNKKDSLPPKKSMLCIIKKKSMLGSVKKTPMFYINMQKKSYVIISKVAENHLWSILKTTELYALKGCLLWYVNSISVFFFSKKLHVKIQYPIYGYKNTIFSKWGISGILNLIKNFYKKAYR